MRSRPLVSLVAVTGAAFTLTALLISQSRDPSPADAAPRGPVTAAERIARAEALLAADPTDDLALANVAVASLVRAKETADSTWYRRADDASRRARAINPRNVLALEAVGTLANARHRFAEAIEPATQALRFAPDRFGTLEILTDANIELGRYREGFRHAEARLRLRPDLASYSRASYAAELRGERELATELMRLAVDAARAGSGDRAWALVQLGLLRLGSGDLAGATREMAAARATAPDDPTAIAGAARVEAAAGNLDAAAGLYREALGIQQIAGYASSLAEIELMRGNRSEVDRYLALAREIDAREAANGVQLDLDQAVVDADFAAPDSAMVAKARRGYQQRPGIVGDDALGWVLTRAGRCDEGLRFARRSLRLGTRDAMFFFHAGMAAECAGQRTEAAAYLTKAMALNTRFSVRWTDTAKMTLARLTARA